MQELVRMGYAVKKPGDDGDDGYVASMAGARFLSVVFASNAPHPYGEEPPPGPFDYVERRLLDDFLRDFLKKTEHGLVVRVNRDKCLYQEPGDAWLDRVLERQEILDEKLFFLHRRMQEHEQKIAGEKWLAWPESSRKEKRMTESFGQFMHEQQTKWISRQF
jgi:hypothetical protein